MIIPVLRQRDRTEFGLPPSNMKGAFGNEGALRFFADDSACSRLSVAADHWFGVLLQNPLQALEIVA
jgi:hypothetical protein